MKSYIVDTNYILRFLLADNPSQGKIVRQYFEDAELQKIKLNISGVVIVETVFAMLQFYKFDRKEISEKLGYLLDLPYLDIEKKRIIKQSLLLFPFCNVSFVDLVIFVESYMKGYELLTFDKKLKNLKIPSGLLQI